MSKNRYKMDDYQTARKFVDFIQPLIESMISKLCKFNVSKPAKIISLESGKATIRFATSKEVSDSNITEVRINSGLTLAPNDFVMVQIANNDFSSDNMFILYKI